LLFVIELNEIGKLIAKQLAALRAAGVGVAEPESGEGIEYPEVAGVAPIQGFDANDGDDNRLRHAILLCCFIERGLVLGPELLAIVDANGLDETIAISDPAAANAGLRRRH